jgi:hypothetical protein
MFFTDSIKIINGQYTCRFNGYKTSSIVLSELEVDIPQVKLKYIYELYKWVYESNTCDKLMITRNVISKYLKEKEEENYTILLNCIEEIDNVIKANYSTFFQDKIDSFFEDRKKIAQYTFEKSTQIEKEINSLTDSMTKNVITAIGVIITAIIANSNKQGFTNNSIKIILLSYLVYLIISTIYHIVPAFFSILQLNGSNSHLIKYYTAFLPEKEVKNIQGNLLGRKRLLFWIYWVLSFIIMIALMGGTFYCLLHLDNVLKLLI